MYVYETYNPTKDETDTITAPNVIELCANILDYNNGIDDNTNDEYIVTFNDCDGNTIIEISEDGLYFAITGNARNNSDITDSMKNDSQKFWEITHSNVKYINFTNPVRMGEAEWDENYEKSDDDSSDDSEPEESNTNIVKLA
jgi:hypothetical protein